MRCPPSTFERNSSGSNGGFALRFIAGRTLSDDAAQSWSAGNTILLERPSPPPALRATILVHGVGNVHYRTQKRSERVGDVQNCSLSKPANSIFKTATRHGNRPVPASA